MENVSKENLKNEEIKEEKNNMSNEQNDQVENDYANTPVGNNQNKLLEKMKQLQELEQIKQHQSEYLASQDVEQELLIPFIVEQLNKECKKRGKDIYQIRQKMHNNTDYAKKVVDKAIKEYKKCQKQEEK